ncbi:MAG: hypothetical protein EBQ99_10525 [Planctomycetes bacterium]|nr:hypothetical protein [Planctomycetota bacterium]
MYAFALHLNNAPESIAFGLLVAGCLLNWRDSVAAWQRTCLMRWMWPWLLWSVLSVMSGLWSPEHALARPSRAVLLPWLVVPVSGFVSSIAVGFLAGAVVATGTQCAAWIRIQSWERIAGVGRDLGTVSALACFASVVALGFVLFAGSPRVRKWAVAALFIALLQLAFTQGRSAILALAIATIWLVWATRIASSETPLSRGRRRAWVAAAYVLVCLCVGALVVRGFTVDRRYQREGDAKILQACGLQSRPGQGGLKVGPQERHGARGIAQVEVGKTQRAIGHRHHGLCRPPGLNANGLLRQRARELRALELQPQPLSERPPQLPAQATGQYDGGLGLGLWVSTEPLRMNLKLSTAIPDCPRYAGQLQNTLRGHSHPLAQ